MTCRLCGHAGEGTLCRECRMDLAAVSANGVECVDCRQPIRTGWVSIKGRCGDCHDKRQSFAALAATKGDKP